MFFIKNKHILNILFGIILSWFPLTIQAEKNQTLSTLEIRTLQTREFTQLSLSNAYQASLNTFQDLGFIITETSPSLSLIVANQTHPDQNQVILATLTIIAKNDFLNTIITRLSLSTYPLYSGEEGTNLNGESPRASNIIRTPTTYQQFYDAFSYTLSLQKKLVNK